MLALSRSKLWLLLAAVLALAALSYLPGLERGFFVFDDKQNITQNSLVRVERLTFEHLRDAFYSWGGEYYPNRGLSRLTFGLNYYFSGGRYDPSAFRITNFVIHALNGVLVFLVLAAIGRTPRMRALLGDGTTGAWLALLAAALWVLHPLQLTAVLYAVQRMASLSASFMLAGLALFLLGRARLEAGRAGGLVMMYAGIGGGVLLGFMCKQNAVLLPLLAFVTELAFYPRAALARGPRRALKVFYGLSVAAPLLLVLLALPVLWPRILEGYQYRDFDLAQRLLTQGRVLVFYLGLFFVPRLREMSLWHDDMPLSVGLLTPLSTVVCWSLLLVAALGAAFAIRRGQVWAWATLFFLAGHLLESGVIALEPIFEHRNYVPSVALSLATVYYGWKLAQLVRMKTALRATVAVLTLATLAFITHTRAQVWSDRDRLAEHLARNHPGSYRAMDMLASSLARRSATVRSMYEAYRSAAAMPAEPIYPLIRMRRLVAGLQFRFASGLTQGDALPAGTPAPDRFTADLLIERDYLARLAATLDREIRARLGRRALNAETIAELDAVRMCLYRNVDLCFGLLDEAKGWVGLALASENISDGGRSLLLFVRSHLHAIEGDFETAHATVRRAIETSDRDIGYQLQEAIYLAKLGRFDEAEAVLARASNGGGATVVGSERLRSTRATIEQIRAEASDTGAAAGPRGG